MPKIRRSPVGEPVVDLAPHWWRFALVAAAVVAVFWSDSVFLCLFAMVPLLLWCGGLFPQTGPFVGLVLLALMVWCTVPRGLGWSGRWVPSADEVLWLHPVLATVVCLIGLSRRRKTGVGWLFGLVLIGFCLTGLALLSALEAPPGDEGVLPGPSGLRIAEQDLSCASGGCARVVNATGDHARESMRAYLAAQGFTPRTAIVTYVDERMCRLTGVVVAHEVCVELRDISAATVQISWYLD